MFIFLFVVIIFILNKYSFLNFILYSFFKQSLSKVYKLLARKPGSALLGVGKWYISYSNRMLYLKKMNYLSQYIPFSKVNFFTYNDLTHLRKLWLSNMYIYMCGGGFFYSQSSIQCKNPAYNILNKWLHSICLNVCCNGELTTWEGGQKLSYCWAIKLEKILILNLNLFSWQFSLMAILFFKHSFKYLLSICCVINTVLSTVATIMQNLRHILSH